MINCRLIFIVSLLLSLSSTRSIYAHYGDVIMGTISSQITSLTIVYSTVYSDAEQRKQQSSASLVFVRGIHRGPVNSPHKWPVTRKMFPFDDVIMLLSGLLRKKLSWPMGAHCMNTMHQTAPMAIWSSLSMSTSRSPNTHQSHHSAMYAKDFLWVAHSLEAAKWVSKVLK